MVSARSVEMGNYIQVGQPLMQIVPEQVWVIANFKEIQLTHMKKGQPVSIKIDTYPGKDLKATLIVFKEQQVQNQVFSLLKMQLAVM